MTTRSTNNSKSINGLRVLELGAAIFGITEEMASRVGSGPLTLSTKGARSFADQQLIGFSHVLCIVSPFAIELALKSLWYALHTKGSPPKSHHLGKLFQTLTDGATDKSDAKCAQDEARSNWVMAQNMGKAPNDYSLDAFLDERADDFINFRYDMFDESRSRQSDHYKSCLYAIMSPLAKRDPETFANFVPPNT